MENKRESDNQKVRLCDAKIIAEQLLKLPASFGETLVIHMKKQKLTSEAMAEALGISTRKISMLRNTVNPSLSLREVTAICILLHLSPEYSDDMIAKAGIRPLPTREHIAYRMLLRSMYLSDIHTCNALLREENIEPLTGEKNCLIQEISI